MVVLLPGITGSVLRKDGKDVWAISGQAARRWLMSLGGSLQHLLLDGDDPGGIVATRVMPVTRMWCLGWSRSMATRPPRSW